MSCTWLTKREAADWIKVHEATIHRYIKSGKLKANKPSGGVVRICLEELNRLGEDSGRATPKD